MAGGRRFARSGSGRQPPPPPVPQSFSSNDDSHRLRFPGSADNSSVRILSPKHFPLPNMSEEGMVIFELSMFLFTVLATLLQYLHLYRTVWWLPQSYTNTTMNFYLIDPYLLGFIVIILGRRLAYSALNKVVMTYFPRELWPLLQQLIRMFLFTFLMIALVFCSCFIMQSTPIGPISCLCYPIIVYFIMFGLSTSPFFDINSLCSSTKDDHKLKTFDGKPLHSCTTCPQTIRSEIASLKDDFNGRMKQIVFSTVMNTYYAGFLPCCFTQKYLNYDQYWVSQHLFFMWLGIFTMYLAHCYSLRYYDVFHRAAIHLGRWVKMEGRTTHLPTHSWAETVLWHQGALVRHCKELYKAEGISTAAEPGNNAHAKFYCTFSNPSVPVSSALCLQVVLILMQFMVLVKSSEWYRLISITLLLFCSYFTLFKLYRDYLVAGKIHQAEQMCQEKNV